MSIKSPDSIPLNRPVMVTVFDYLSLHISDVGQRFGDQKGNCPVTDDVRDRRLRLPLFKSLSEAEQEKAVNAIF